MDIDSRLIRTYEFEENVIKIIFDPTVRIIRSDPTMSPMTLFSNIGGCLGLTLGYSILQMVEKVEIFLQYWLKAVMIKIRILEED